MSQSTARVRRSTPAREGAPQVLVVDPNHHRRSRIAALFDAAEFRTSQAANLVDVRHYLDRARAASWLLAIADSRPPEASERLRDQLRAEYPGTPMVALGTCRTRSLAGRLSVDHHPTLAASVHELVESSPLAG